MSFFDRVKHFFVPSHDNAYRPHLLRRRALIVCLALMLLTEAGLVASLVARQSGQSFFAAVIQSEILVLTNVQRAQAHVGTLAENSQLDAAAQAKAADMAKQGYFAHVGPDGKQPWAWVENAGYDYRYAGENLAVRFVDSKDVLLAWMASPSHRANVLKPVYQDIGVGVAEGTYKGEPATFVVQYFGTPQGSAALGAAALSSPSSFSSSLGRQLMRLLAEPRSSTAWVLGGVAALLMLALALAFFLHIQLQAKDLLLSGTLVVAVALTLVVINTHSLSGVVADEEAAAVVYSSP